MTSKQSFIIQGLAGERKLRGTVRIHGAKNAALKAMVAAILFDGPVTLHNVPDTGDVETTALILEKLGARVKRDIAERTVTIDPTAISSTDIDAKLAESMRTSVVFTGPMLARFGKVSLPAPGGCVIGARPIDFFINGYKELGITTEEKDCLYKMAGALTDQTGASSKGGHFRGGRVVFPRRSVGATETLMMAATLAEGKTTLENCAQEPEIVNVAEWLIAGGAKIQGAGTATMVIEGSGGKLLSAAAVAASPYIAIPDRIEAGSFLILGALCAQELTIENCRPDHMQAVIDLLKKSGVAIEIKDASIIQVKNSINDKAADRSAAQFKSFDVQTLEYPGFPTDLQAPITVFLTQAAGTGRVVETIYENRFKYVEDLVKMGADISMVDPHEIAVKGPTPLVAPSLSANAADPMELSARDIRAGFAIVMAALIARGKFSIDTVHLIDRGYERLEETLRELGAEVERASA